MYLTIHVELEIGLDAAVGLEVRRVAAEGQDGGTAASQLPLRCAFAPLQGLPPRNHCSAEAIVFFF